MSLNDVIVGRVVLHVLRGPLHVHQAQANLVIFGDVDHFGISLKTCYIVQDFCSGFDGNGSPPLPCWCRY